MKLYSMRRLSDGKFFIHTYANGKLAMSNKPVFWRTPDSIWVNLKRVCSKFEPWRDRWDCTQKGWTGFDPKKLREWEVIVTNVKVLGEAQIPAEKFVDKSALRKMDVRIKKLPRAA
jgi:hypothetical protein